MKRARSIAAVAIVFSSSQLVSCDLQDIFDEAVHQTGLTDSEIVGGLKEALKLSSTKASLDLGEVNGYLGNALVRIALPDDAEAVYDQALELKANFDGCSSCSIVSSVSSLVNDAWDIFEENADSLVTSLNRGAEKAAPEAAGVFADAITSLSFTQGRSILFDGDSLAATRYLDTTTRTGLNGVFRPIVDSTLSLVSATRYWADFAESYNTLYDTYECIDDLQCLTELASLTHDKNTLARQSISLSLIDLPDIGLPTSLSTDLGGYTTGKALDGLFTVVGEQEAELRADPIGHLKDLGSLVEGFASDLIEKVFTADE